PRVDDGLNELTPCHAFQSKLNVLQPEGACQHGVEVELFGRRFQEAQRLPVVLRVARKCADDRDLAAGDERRSDRNFMRARLSTHDEAAAIAHHTETLVKRGSSAREFHYNV